MQIITETDPYEVLDDIEYDNGVKAFVKAFGEDNVADFIEGYLYRRTEQEIIDEFNHSESKFYAIKKIMTNKNIEKLSRAAMMQLHVSDSDCEKRSIPCEEAERDELGRVLISVEEDKNQMTLFPDLEEGLPPYHIKIPVSA